jgi:quercetin dioxygenase-like cupin family protein
MTPGETLHPNVGETLTCVRSARDGGRFEYEVTLAPGADDSPPPHAHDSDEEVEVISGTLVFIVNGQEQRLTAGSRFVIPAGQFHTFRKGSKTEAVHALGVSGRGFERLVDQFRGEGAGFSRLAVFLATPEGRASYKVGSFVRVVVDVAACLGRLRGVRPVPP